MPWPDLLRLRRPERGTGPHGTGGLTGGRPLPQPARFGRQGTERRGFLRSLWLWLSVLTVIVLGVLWLSTSSTPFFSGSGRQEMPVLSWQACDEAPSRERCVVDGDSVRIGGETIRLAGLDTPELAGACEAERIAARAARDALIAWLNAGAFAIEGTARDKYGRPLRSFTRGPPGLRSDAAEALVAQGVARPYGGEAREGWCG